MALLPGAAAPRVACAVCLNSRGRLLDLSLTLVFCRQTIKGAGVLFESSYQHFQKYGFITEITYRGCVCTSVILDRLALLVFLK